MRVCVVGGGISGLSAVYYLSKAAPQFDVKLIESSQRVGGWINSYTGKSGALFETGPRTIRSSMSSAHLLDVINDLGISDKILPINKTDPASRVRYILFNNQLCATPTGIKSIISRTPLLSKPLGYYLFRYLMTMWQKPLSVNETLHEFASRRMGQEFADNFMDPFCRGIFAADCRILSARSCFPQLFSGYKLDKSILKASTDSLLRCRDWTMWGFKDGISVFPNAFYQKFNDKITLNTKLTRIEETNDGKVKVYLNNGSSDVFDYVISTIPSFSLADALPASMAAEIDLLKQIKYVDTAVVNLEYPRSALEKVPVGFGFLVPSKEKSKLLGLIFDSHIFPQADANNGTVRLTAMIGGSWFNEILGTNPTNDEITSLAIEETNSVLDIGKPLDTHCEVARSCIPSYHKAHLQIRHQLTSSPALKNVALGGNYLYGVGIVDAINRSKAIIKQKLQFAKL